MPIEYPDHRTKVLQSMEYDPVRSFVRRRHMAGWTISEICWMSRSLRSLAAAGKVIDNANKTLARKIESDHWPSMTLEEYHKAALDIIFGEFYAS